ncbi:M48 family metalloprotease [Streptomyces tubercidicus]|uniref:M48 family metalloprotease n=1 Tax=Streptomyces tubercidicus TaxID=47759 RepID=UPI0037973626
MDFPGRRWSDIRPDVTGGGAARHTVPSDRSVAVLCQLLLPDVGWLDHLNALAAAGHIVGVTRFSLERLSDGQLAAVLAHELGHHVRGHAWSSLPAQWYAVPGRLVWAVVRKLIRLVTVTGHGRMGAWASGRQCCFWWRVPPSCWSRWSTGSSL